jgi:hypothetical protein
MRKSRHRNKDHVPQARTGGLPNTGGCKVYQDAISTDTSVKEQVLQCEACANKIAAMTSMEEQEVQTDICETEVTESSPKKRRRKRDKIVSPIKE